ncbi:MAG TPA: glycosyltransferase [Caulobacteraceae bacterium]
MTVSVLLGGLTLAVWTYLLIGHGGFWRMRERDDRDEATSEPTAWPSVVAVVPARNEADVIARSVGGLLAQDYPGAFRVILVDDNSEDGTAAVAAEAAARLEAGERLRILSGAPLAAGWTGKLWAVRQGVSEAAAFTPDYLLLTDADIAHSPDNLRKLVSRAEAGQRVMVSLMARLTNQTWAEKLLIPAFVFFFDMLYPFGWVNDPRRKMAAAAGGCMLIKRTALEAAGGIDSIRAEIIDDCAMGRRMKSQGPIWLGLTDRAVSLRPYQTVGEIGKMVSRSAYAQLGYSPLLLAGTILGMVLVYLSAPFLTLFGHGLARWLGLGAWAAMAISFQPMLAFYRRSPLWGLALPVIGALYTAFTLDSAIQVWCGRGGMWKGRAQAAAELR